MTDDTHHPEYADFENLLVHAFERNATDIHIAEGELPRIRVESALKKLESFQPLNMPQVIERILSFCPERGLHEKSLGERLSADCAFGFKLSRFRANIYRAVNGWNVALRVIPNKRLGVSQIGLPFPVLDICAAKRGIFIITGANGMGKTTSLAAMIDVINETRSAHVITIEDPIEHVFENKKALISQREVGVHVPEFYDAIRSAVRENPDVVVLGEMRDLETTRTALELAETGHLVFATLHTRSAISTIDRLIAQFPAGEQEQIRSMVSESIIGILAQILLPRRGGGLVAGFELLLPNTAVKNCIRENRLHQLTSAMQTGKREGMFTMQESLEQMRARGIIDADTFERA